MIVESVFDVCLKHEKQLRHIAEVAIKRSSLYTVEEVLSYLFSRMDGILRTYNETPSVLNCSLKTHISRNARWYAFKFVNAKRIQLFSEVEFIDAHYHEKSDLVEREEVYNILEKLSAYQRLILTMRYAQEKTYDQIAEILEVSIATARNHCLDALRAAQEIAVE